MDGRGCTLHHARACAVHCIGLGRLCACVHAAPACTRAMRVCMFAIHWGCRPLCTWHARTCCSTGRRASLHAKQHVLARKTCFTSAATDNVCVSQQSSVTASVCQPSSVTASVCISSLSLTLCTSAVCLTEGASCLTEGANCLTEGASCLTEGASCLTEGASCLSLTVSEIGSQQGVLRKPQAQSEARPPCGCRSVAARCCAASPTTARS